MATTELFYDKSELWLISDNPNASDKYIRSQANIMNTYFYIAEKFKKGMYFSHRIDGNKFLPFSYDAYQNNWDDYIHDTRESIYKESLYKTGYRSNPIPKHLWYANNGLIRFDNHEKGANIETIRHLFETVVKERDVSFCDVFINRRDFPILRKNGKEAYDAIYGDVDITTHHDIRCLSPILSGSTTSEFKDIAIPNYDDWARAVYQHTGESLEGKKFPEIKLIPWEEKINTAIFRGSSTGLGVTLDTNPRIKAVSLSDNNLLDAKFTKWQRRFRKHPGNRKLSWIDPSLVMRYPASKRYFMTLQDQSKYKYILHLPGHVAAYRLSYELSSGSTIIMPEHMTYHTWYSLIPWKHYVPVELDLSDLKDKIRWCRENDEECRTIAKNAFLFYRDHLGYDSILDFLAKTLNVTSGRAVSGVHYSTWLDTFLVNNVVDKEAEKFAKSQLKYGKPIEIYPKKVNPFVVFSAEDLAKFNPGGKLMSIGHRDFFSRQFTSKPMNSVEYTIGRYAINNMLQWTMCFPWTYRKTDRLWTRTVAGIPWKDLSYNDRLDAIITLLLTMHRAYFLYGFVHGDLSLKHIIFKKRKISERFFYKDDIWIEISSEYTPTIVNFSKSYCAVDIPDIGIAYVGNSIRSTIDSTIDISKLMSHLGIIGNFNGYYDAIDFLLSKRVFRRVKPYLPKLDSAVWAYAYMTKSPMDLVVENIYESFWPITKSKLERRWIVSKIDDLLRNLERPDLAQKLYPPNEDLLDDETIDLPIVVANKDCYTINNKTFFLKPGIQSDCIGTDPLIAQFMSTNYIDLFQQGFEFLMGFKDEKNMPRENSHLLLKVLGTLNLTRISKNYPGVTQRVGCCI